MFLWTYLQLFSLKNSLYIDGTVQNRNKKHQDVLNHITSYHYDYALVVLIAAGWNIWRMQALLTSSECCCLLWLPRFLVFCLTEKWVLGNMMSRVFSTIFLLPSAFIRFGTKPMTRKRIGFSSAEVMINLCPHFLGCSLEPISCFEVISVTSCSLCFLFDESPP